MLKDFTLPVTAPDLVGGLGQGGLCDDFVAKFKTSSWKKTPAKAVWFIGIDGMQFTVRKSDRDGLDFAFYSYDTVADFKKAFSDKSHAFNAVYFQLNDTGVNYKYPALRIINFLQSRGLW